MKCAREYCNKLVKEYGGKYCSKECFHRSLREGKSIQRKRITVECASCGKPIEKRPCEVKENNFCDNKCRGQWLSKNNVGENNPGWSDRIEKVCPNCGSVSSVPTYRVRGKDDRNFCDKRCWYEYRKKSGESAGEKHYRYGKKLSKESCEKISNKLKGKKLPQEHRKNIADGHKGEKAYNYCKTEIHCDNCGKPILRVPSTNSDKNFCSMKCRGEWLSKNQTGENSPRYGKSCSEETRQKLRDAWERRRLENKCGYKASSETKRKLRIAAIKRMQKQSKAGERVVPSFNFAGCEYFAKFDKFYKTNGQYATNGGEFHIKELGYFVDYYNPDLKLIMEWDEEYHYKGGKLSKKDLDRQREIELHYSQFLFVRIRESDIIQNNKLYNI